MIIYIEGLTNIPDLIIESVTMKDKEGKEILITWDETDISRQGEFFDLRGKGVSFTIDGEERYANGRIDELRGYNIEEMNLDSDVGGNKFVVTEMEISDKTAGSDKNILYASGQIGGFIYEDNAV